MITDFEQFFINRGEFKDLEFTLDRIKAAAAELGISDNIAKNIIHIAGTNGKGSTANFIEQILQHRGEETGCFTSPHIDSVTERIRTGGNQISDDGLNSLFAKCIKQIERYQLSYFEALTLMSFLHFKEQKVDTAIIETGLGGRLDSTNILDRKIPVITTISKDHTDFLGDDILKIADEKLGIVKDNLLVFVGCNDDHMSKYLDYKLHSKTIVRGNYSTDGYFGFDQPFANNLRLAEAVADYIVTGSMPEKLSLPSCRMERHGMFVIDGAHNADALTRLGEKYRDKKPIVVFSCTRDRDVDELVSIIETFAGKVILTSIPDNDRSIQLNNINTNHLKEESPERAVKIAVELSENTDILICGSLYLCAHLREIIAKGLL